MAEEEIAFRVGEDGPVTVKGWDGLERWIEKERAHWAWLVPGTPVTDAHNWATTVKNSWESVQQGARNIRGGGNSLAEASRALAPLANSPFILSDGPEGTLVLEIRAIAGDTAGAFAYALLKGNLSPNAARNRDEMLGAILTVMPDVRNPVEISNRLQRERANYRSSLKSAIDRLDKANSERNTAFEEDLVRGKRIAAQMLRKRRDKWKAVQEAWQAQATNAVASIRAVEASYLEAMRLQAPVKYWQDKASEHASREWWAIARLVAFFPLALAGLGKAFWESASYLLDHAAKPGSTTPVALYVIITGGLAVFSTLLFWIGRLLTKLYLSEHHLRNDANERAIMTQTYLALTKESAASDADRNIILAAIFRSTPDGIVRDDGPADVSIQALLSKLATR